MKARPYQRNAVDAIFSYFEEKDGNPLVVMPTGTGKSVVISIFSKEACQTYPGTKINVSTHVQELVAQNFEKFVMVWPNGDSGIFAAGLNKRQLGKQVTFCSIQSVYDKAEMFQHIDLLLVDEAHTIPPEAMGMWHKFISDLKIINPNLKVVGFTATDYRMKSGKLTRGKDRIFTDVCYEYNILEAIDDGYLVAPANPAHALKTRMDTSAAKSSGGEFITKSLQSAVDKDPITKACVAEIIQNGMDRGSWLVFGTGIEHCEHIRDEIRSYGITCEALSHKTPKAERRRILADFKAQRIRCIVNNGILTTGFDANIVDLIACMRPTKSPGLWVQILGRGTRPIYAPGYNLNTRDGRLAAIAASMKPNFLVLDFTNNTTNFGVIDKITVEVKESSGMGDAPMKICPQCDMPNFAGVRVCRTCGYEFPPNEKEISSQVNQDALLSTQVRENKAAVTSVYYHRQKGARAGSPDCLRVEYLCGVNTYTEIIYLESRGSWREEACSWWRKRSTLQGRAPNTVTEALDRSGELRVPNSITYQKQGKYQKVIAYQFT